MSGFDYTPLELRAKHRILVEFADREPRVDLCLRGGGVRELEVSVRGYVDGLPLHVAGVAVKWCCRSPAEADRLGMYDIHDNGARPFRVVVDFTKQRAQVYPRRGARWPAKGGPVFAFDFLCAFVPQGDSTLQGVRVGCDAPEDGPLTGNTLLFLLDPTTYLWIGNSAGEGEILLFQSAHLVTSFCSPVLNSDVPYAWAQTQISPGEGEPVATTILPSEGIELLGGFTGDPYAAWYMGDAIGRKIKTFSLLNTGRGPLKIPRDEHGNVKVFR